MSKLKIEQIFFEDFTSYVRDCKSSPIEDLVIRDRLQEYSRNIKGKNILKEQKIVNQIIKLSNYCKYEMFNLLNFLDEKGY